MRDRIVEGDAAFSAGPKKAEKKAIAFMSDILPSRKLRCFSMTFFRGKIFFMAIDMTDTKTDAPIIIDVDDRCPCDESAIFPWHPKSLADKEISHHPFLWSRTLLIRV